MKNLLLAISIGMALHSHASDDPFAELDNQVELAFQSEEQEQAEFETWYTQHMQEYADWRTAYLKRLDAERELSVLQWGDTKVGGQHYQVVQGEKSDSRTLVDFDQEVVTVEVLVDVDADSNEIVSRLNQQIEHTLDSNSDVVVSVPESVDLDKVTERLLSFDKDVEKEALEEIVSETALQLNEIEKQADRLAQQAQNDIDEKTIAAQQTALIEQAKQRLVQVNQTYKTQRESLSTSNGSGKKIVSLQVKMPSSSLEKRIKPFLNEVYKQSEEFDIKPDLILAIMHTESSFNPSARSPIPAFGLMQVVATSAGHDVNKLVHKIDKPMKESDLYDPEYNIQAGTGYLDILNTRYLREIKDPKSREYCIIAAYNTGAGNVAKAFGERRVKAAAKKINSMTPEQVYDTLINNLPYEETVNYLKKVTKRQASYRGESS